MMKMAVIKPKAQYAFNSDELMAEDDYFVNYLDESEMMDDGLNFHFQEVTNDENTIIVPPRGHNPIELVLSAPSSFQYSEEDDDLEFEFFDQCDSDEVMNSFDSFDSFESTESFQMEESYDPFQQNGQFQNGMFCQFGYQNTLNYGCYGNMF